MRKRVIFALSMALIAVTYGLTETASEKRGALLFGRKFLNFAILNSENKVLLKDFQTIVVLVFENPLPGEDFPYSFVAVGLKIGDRLRLDLGALVNVHGQNRESVRRSDTTQPEVALFAAFSEFVTKNYSPKYAEGLETISYIWANPEDIVAVSRPFNN